MSGDGGADRDRTGDPLLAKQVLSQLSYSPVHDDADACRLGVPRRKCAEAQSRRESGGSGKSRTSDLTLIRGAL